MLRLLFTLLLSQFSILLLVAQNAKYDYFYHEAERQSLKGNYDAAFDLFNYCLKLNPESGAARYQLSNLNRAMRRDSLAVLNMEEAVRLYPDNYWYRDMLVKLYYGARNTDKAKAELEDMAVRFPEKSEVLMMLLETYASQNDYENMIKVLDKLEVKEGKSEQLSMEKYRIYVQMKDEKKAFKEMNELAMEYPNDLRYKVLIGDLYMSQDKMDKAYEVYNEVAKQDSDNVSLLMALTQYYSKLNDEPMVQDCMFKLVTNSKLDRNVRVQLVGSIVYESLKNGKDSVNILNMFDRILAMPQEDVSMHELCARYMASTNMPKERLKPVLHQMIALEPESDIARNQLLAYAVEENDTEDVITLCKTAVDYSAANPIYYYYLGIAYYMKDSLQMALDVYKKGLPHVDTKEDVGMIARMYSVMGELYHRLGDNKNAYLAYDSCLVYRPDDESVLNNYAYYLSEDKVRLDKAEEMSRRSNEIEPDNPTYIDTYAWILFQQKKYKEARVYIDKAIDIMGDSITSADATVVEHAGDIYYKCGDKVLAYGYWKQAASLAGDDISHSLEQKIRRKKL